MRVSKQGFYPEFRFVSGVLKLGFKTGFEFKSGVSN